MLEDVRSIIANQLGTDVDKVGWGRALELRKLVDGHTLCMGSLGGKHVFVWVWACGCVWGGGGLRCICLFPPCLPSLVCCLGDRRAYAVRGMRIWQ